MSIGDTENLKVIVYQDGLTCYTRIAILIISHNGNRGIYNPITKEVREIKDGLGMNDFEDMVIKLPYELCQKFFKAMAETLDERGIKTENDSKLQGTMEAMRYHLEDMRKLLKLSHKEPK